ncbi:DUF2568 domain-containing protein [Zhihengliuella salsuginis]|uniref:DUF2568 domain-containing protein n=1 Tax=Zhihengliuella salsuginis TaxID=578222 RepID=A0ABQ3GIF7_9MICC|nr:DUF2568 domain-containing protein [Zhihengliuella salsuginis]GHD08767.1 hypothetical protein GCM10008096_20760 [Zhihengliuella salsuginis]
MTKAANALSFLLEVALIGAVVMWAIAIWDLAPMLAVAMAGVPAAVLTAVFITSNSKWRLMWPVRPVVAHGLFIAGAIVLIGLEHLSFGWIFLVLAFVSIGLTWRLRGSMRRTDEEMRRLRGAEAVDSGDDSRQRPTGRRAAR